MIVSLKITLTSHDYLLSNPQVDKRKRKQLSERTGGGNR